MYRTLVVLHHIKYLTSPMYPAGTERLRALELKPKRAEVWGSTYSLLQKADSDVVPFNTFWNTLPYHRYSHNRGIGIEFIFRGTAKSPNLGQVRAWPSTKDVQGIVIIHQCLNQNGMVCSFTQTSPRTQKAGPGSSCNPDL